MILSEPLISGAAARGMDYYLICDTDKYGKKVYKFIRFNVSRNNNGRDEPVIDIDCLDIANSWYFDSNKLTYSHPFYCRPIYKAKAIWH